MTSLSLIPRTRSLDPVRRVSRDLDAMFDAFFSDWTGGEPVRFRHDWGEWSGAPRVDVSDRGKEFVLRAEVPGYSREQLHVDVSEGAVSLRGERSSESAEVSECYVCRERSADRFERTIPLPEEVRTDGVTAHLKDGLLTLTLPKVHEEHRREVPVTEG